MYAKKVLPYAVEEPEGKQIDRDLEIALITCLTEEKRKKKPGLLGGAPEKVVFISKLYYPFWAIPSENETLLLDGLGQNIFTVNYMVIPDVDKFIEQIKSCEGNPELFKIILRANSKTFEEFMAETRFSFNTIVGDKNFLSAILSYLRGKTEESKAKTEELPLIVEKQYAKEIAQEFFTHEKLIADELEKLKLALETLKEETEKIENKINRNIIQMQNNFEKEIYELKTSIDEESRKLSSEKEEKITKIRSFLEGEIERLLSMKMKLQNEIHELERKKREYERRMKESMKEESFEHSKRWKLLALEAENKISECKGKIKLYTQIQEKLSEEIKEITEKIEKEYEEKLNKKKKELSSLENVYKLKIEQEKKKIEEILALTDTISTQIEWLIDQKKMYLSNLKQVMLPLKVEAPTVICVPFYISCFESENKLRYHLFPPVFASTSVGVMKKIQTALLKRGLEARINAILKPRSDSLTLLVSSLSERIQSDKNFENQVAQRASKVNVLKSRDFKKFLLSGLEKLVEREILKPEEKTSIIDFYVGH